MGSKSGKLWYMLQIMTATGVHTSPVVALKALLCRGFLTLQLMQRHHRCRQNHHCPNGFYEELQVLRCESRSHHSVDVPDILSTWSSADLHDVARFATVEAKTATRVFLHRVGAVQVHRLGGWRHCGSRRLGEGGGCGGRWSGTRNGVEQGWLGRAG